MAKCEICGKGVTFGMKVSHSHRRSNRTWKPNVRRIKHTRRLFFSSHNNITNITKRLNFCFL